MLKPMKAFRTSTLAALAALFLVSGLSGCIVAGRPGHFRGDNVAEAPNWHHRNWNGNGNWHQSQWQGNGGQGGGSWNQHY